VIQLTPSQTSMGFEPLNNLPQRLTDNPENTQCAPLDLHEEDTRSTVRRFTLPDNMPVIPIVILMLFFVNKNKNICV
jgi:hypothetical protein